MFARECEEIAEMLDNGYIRAMHAIEKVLQGRLEFKHFGSILVLRHDDVGRDLTEV